MRQAARLTLATLAFAGLASAATASEEVYADFPVTVKGYSGDAKTSVSYSGQMARHVLHDSLKQLVGEGGDEQSLLAYFEGKEPGREIIAPKTKGGFVIAQSTVDEISKNRDLAGSTYKGAVPGWPNNLTGPEVVRFWIAKAAAAEGGVDLTSGYDYAQLVSKFIMGAVSYNQVVDKYLDENLEADVKPNDQPYSEGAAYTGKEHSWDEAFGYFGAPAHALTLSPAELVDIAKLKEGAFAAADHNGDGKVDLTKEMTFGPAYYAASFDASVAGTDKATNYAHGIVQAFLDGRKLITAAEGEKLTDEQRATLKGHAREIETLWQQVLAEAVFKYAGEVYGDLKKLNIILESKGEADKAFADYVKHWGELKGFSLALQTGRQNLGETAVRLNRLIGFGPVLLNSSQVIDVDSDGNYVKGEAALGEYMLHMLKVQQLMADTYAVKARNHDMMAELSSLAEKIGGGASAEND